MSISIPIPAPHEMTRLLRRVEYEPNSGCWLWSGSPNKYGYGTARAGGVNVGAHRLFYRIFAGEIPDFADDGTPCFIRHKCDTPACVNPGHLVPGSHTQNMADMFQRGRQRPVGLPGEKSPRAVISQHDVSVMLQRRLAGHSSSEIAADYPVSVSHVRKILNGTKWKSAGPRTPNLPRPIRVIRGEDNPSAKLSPDIVRSILKAVTEGKTLASLAAKYGVSVPVVWEIKHRKAWAHVEPADREAVGDNPAAAVS